MTSPRMKGQKACQACEVDSYMEERAVRGKQSVLWRAANRLDRGSGRDKVFERPDSEG